MWTVRFACGPVLTIIAMEAYFRTAPALPAAAKAALIALAAAGVILAGWKRRGWGFHFLTAYRCRTPRGR